MDDKLYIQQVFRYNKIKSYILYPELDERGRLHYHGILTLSNTEYIRFEKHARHKLRQLGHVDTSDCTQLKNNMRYMIYMKKNWMVTKDILEISDPIMSQSEKLKPSIVKQQQNIPSILDYFL